MQKRNDRGLVQVEGDMSDRQMSQTGCFPEILTQDALCDHHLMLQCQFYNHSQTHHLKSTQKFPMMNAPQPRVLV